MVRAVAVEKPDAIAIVCTNMVGAALAEPLEQELDIPIYDSIATALWTSLRIAGAAPSEVKGYGRLFTDARLA